MTLLAEYRDARRDEDFARLRRVITLRAMVATGVSQRQIADALGVSQSAVSQQLKSSPDLTKLPPEVLLELAAPVLRTVAEDNGYTRLAVFGSVARCQARHDSDTDLVVQAPPGTSSFAFIRFKHLMEQILGRQIDLVSCGGLKPKLDDDIRREAVLL